MPPRSVDLFKPPPSEGTTSPQRALRWQSASPDGSERGGERDNDARSLQSGSTGAVKGSKASRRQKKEKKEKDKPKFGHEHWFSSGGLDGMLGPGGSLYSFTSKGKPRPGMAHPPRVPEVARALLADLNDWGVSPMPWDKKQEKGDEKAFKPNIALVQPGRHITFNVDDGSPPQTGSRGATAGGNSYSSPTAAMQNSRLGSASSTFRSSFRGAALAKPSAKKVDSTWQFEEGKLRKPTLDTAPEGEVKWHSFRLKKKSRELGFQLERADVEDLGELVKDHNKILRSMLPPHDRALSSSAPALLSRQVSNWNAELKAGYKMMHNGLSGEVIRSELEEPIVRPSQTFHYPAPEEASAERLLELADMALHAGPNRLQALSRQSKISVLTGSRIVGSGEKLAPDKELEDFLYLGSSSPAATPRSTHTGKPLPMPYWGRNGSAPVLQMRKVKSGDLR